MDEQPRLTRLGDLLGDVEADAIAAHDAYTQGIPRGPVTTFANLDHELGGALAPGVHVAHGSPGSGKTALALQIAGSCGCPALYVSAEMGALELFRRLTARVTRTYLGRLKSGELAPAAAVQLHRQAAAAAPLLALADATTAPAAPGWIRDAAEVTRGDAPHLLIVIDSVHSWAEAFAAELPEYDAINAAIASLRTLSGQLDCAILAVAERNRASMAKGGQNAAAGSRKFEYSASTVIDLARDMEKPPDAGGEVPVCLTVSKNRNGSAGRKFDLRFHGALQEFREA